MTAPKSIVRITFQTLAPHMNRAAIPLRNSVAMAAAWVEEEGIVKVVFTSIIAVREAKDLPVPEGSTD